MSSFFKRPARKIADAVFSQLTRSAGGRRLLAQLVDRAQHSLGIGAGAGVSSSGERVVFDELRRRSDVAGPLCIFDVGSNQGQFLDLTGQCLKEVPHTVHCFEPSAATYQTLLQHAGGRDGVTFNPFGLGKESGEFELFADEPGSGLASLTNRRLDHVGIYFNHHERVQIRTLDAYCAERGIEKIDLLKVDVEGHELEVLRGGTRMFAEGRVAAATFEFGGTHIDTRTFFQDFYYFFQSHGMSAIFRILPSGELDRIGAYDETQEQFRVMNFLVFRDGSTPAASGGK